MGSANKGVSNIRLPDPPAFPRAPGLRIAVLASMLFTFECFSGCATGPRAPAPRAGAPAQPEAVLAAFPSRDRVLWQYRLAAGAWRQGRCDEASRLLDESLATLGGLLSGPDEAARRARGYFSEEAMKTFIGEPYERVMAYYYRGLLYWRAGEPDNARACFRSAALQDADVLAHRYASDWVLLDYLDGLATSRIDGDGADALARARANSRAPLPGYDRVSHVLCFAEFGRGPEKIASGRYGEQLRFAARPPLACSAVLTIGDRRIELPPWDDLVFQATTRGGRVMDHILRNKAVFKDAADTLGNAAFAGAAIAETRAEDLRRRGESADRQEDAATAMAVAGAIGKVLAASTQPRADTRTWDNLPQYLSFAAFSLPPGSYKARLEFLDAGAQVLPEYSQDLTIAVAPHGRDTVLLLSQWTK